MQFAVGQVERPAADAGALAEQDAFRASAGMSTSAVTACGRFGILGPTAAGTVWVPGRNV